MITLRPYQNEIINRVRGHMAAGHRSILIQSPTGSGKTALTAHMIRTAASKKMGAWFIVHRKELIRQSMRAFQKAAVTYGVVAPWAQAEPRQLVQIASVQTLSRRYTGLPAPRLIVWDECHHLGAASWKKIFEAFPESFHIGLTATPVRLDGQGLGSFFNHMVLGPRVESLIDDGFLSRYRLFCPPGIDTAGVHMRAGDFARGELAAAADRPTITGDAIREYKKRADGKRAIVFCVSVEHSEHVAAEFRSRGITAKHIDGTTSSEERDRAIADFGRGDIRVLCNVDLFGEGFDVPSIECAILLRPTASLGLYLQMVGRALRPCEGKTEAIILDHAGNANRHGFPDDDRQWTLDGGTPKRPGDGAGPAIRTCKVCFAAQKPGQAICQFCGALMPAEPRVVEEVAGELVEVDPNLARQTRLQEQRQAKTLDELIELGKRRGYARPELWARHYFRAKNAKRVRA